MKPNVAIISIIIALIIGFGAGFALRPVLAPATIAAAGARGQQYFAAHIDEARQVVAECQSGSVRGDECFNAGQAVTEADGREHFNKFFGH